MTKKNATILVILSAMLVLFSTVMLLAPRHNYSSEINNVVEVVNGMTTPGSFKTMLTVNKGAEYSFSANWWKEDDDPGFVTGLMVTDESGKELYTVTGGNLYSDSVPMKLEAGKYCFSFETLGSAEAYAEYVNRRFPGSDTDDIDSGYFHDGVWEMKYRVEINQYLKNAYAIGLGAGTLFGILIIALVVVASRKEDAPVRKYDERQIAAQGKAYKYGFITMTVYYALMTVAFGTKTNIPVETNLLMLFGIFMGAIVTVTKLIMDEAYFRMDENRPVWIGFFVLTAVFNLGIGIAHIVRQETVSDGILTFNGTANLICGVFVAYFLIVMLIKGIKDREEE